MGVLIINDRRYEQVSISEVMDGDKLYYKGNFYTADNDAQNGLTGYGVLGYIEDTDRHDLILGDEPLYRRVSLIEMLSEYKI